MSEHTTYEYQKQHREEQKQLREQERERKHNAWIDRQNTRISQFLDRFENRINELNSQGLTEFDQSTYSRIRNDINTARQQLKRENIDEANLLSFSIGDNISEYSRKVRQMSNSIWHSSTNIHRVQPGEHLSSNYVAGETFNSDVQALTLVPHVDDTKNDTQFNDFVKKLYFSVTDDVVRDIAFVKLRNAEQNVRNQQISHSEKQTKFSALFKEIIQHAELEANEWKDTRSKIKSSKIDSDGAEQEVALLEVQELIEDDILEQSKLPNADTKQLKILHDNIIFLKTELASGVSIDTDIKSVIDENFANADVIIVDESIRRKAVASTMMTLKEMGFSPINGSPFIIEGDMNVVVIDAQRIDKRHVKVCVNLNGSFSARFDNYSGSNNEKTFCRSDRKKFAKMLSETYGIKLTNEQVIWDANPDLLYKRADSFPSSAREKGL